MNSSCGDSDAPFYHVSATHPPCKYRDGIPCDPCNELSEIEAQMEEHYSRPKDLKDLHERYRQASERRNHVHSPLIHRFPPEIVADIFTLAFPPRAKNSCYSTEEKASQLILGKVCHRWRMLALGTPSLWCDISVDAAKPNFPLLNHQLAHSGTLPLSIHLNANYRSSTRHGKEAISYVLKQLHRTASFCINLRTDFASMSDLDYPKAAPLLEELHIHNLWRQTSPLRLAIEPPRPRHVYLFSLYQEICTSLDWINVSSLTLENVRFDLLPELLRSKHFTRLVLGHVYEDPTEQALVINQSIEDLTLQTLESASFMLRMTSLPSLRRLDIQLGEVLAIRPMLCEFLDRSRCSLRVLGIRAYDGRGESAVIQILENTSTLHQLTLQLMPSPSSKFEPLIVLRRLSSRGRSFLPCLQSLSLQMRGFPPPIDLLLDMMSEDDHSYETTNYGPHTFRPLRELHMRLQLGLADIVSAISPQALLRILQLRAAGKTVSIRRLELDTVTEDPIDIIEYRKKF